MKFCGLLLSLAFCLCICGCKNSEKNIADEKYYIKFHLVHDTPYHQLQQPPDGHTLCTTHDGSRFYVKKDSEMVITQLNDAYAYQNEFGNAVIRITMNDKYRREFTTLTGKHTGRQLAIIVNGEICCAPVIGERITGGTMEISVPSIEKAEEIAGKLYNKKKLFPWW